MQYFFTTKERILEVMHILKEKDLFGENQANSNQELLLTILKEKILSLFSTLKDCSYLADALTPLANEKFLELISGQLKSQRKIP